MEVDQQIEELAKTIKMEVDSDVDFKNDPTIASSSDPLTCSTSEIKDAKEVEKTGENLSEMNNADEDMKMDENLSDRKDTKEDVKTEENSSDMKTDESLVVMKTGDSTSNVITGERLSDDKKDTESSRSDETKVKEIIVHLSVEGANEDTDDKTILMTVEEVKQYLLKKVGEYMSSPVNPLFALREKVKELENTGKEQIDEFSKLYKGLQLLERKQEVFLRKSDILPKITMSHASVSADLPVQPVIKPESLIKKELTVTKIDTPAPNKTTLVSTNIANSSTKPASKPANIECIDLTDDTEPPVATAAKKNTCYSAMSMLKHPAPLPPRPFSSTQKLIPPKPRLKVFSEDRGIVLQWDMPPNPQGRLHDTVASFEISGYQEQKNSVINTLLWKKIGSVKAMSLPMACTLTQFVDGNRYHFAIRAVDIHGQTGHYSDAISIVYNQKSSLKNHLLNK